MVTILILSVLIAILVSAVCSLMEAALYSVPIAYIQSLENEGKKTGKILSGFKRNMSRPISAILILNTLSHTIGASMAGWAAGEVLGSKYLVVFSVFFTLAILYLSEIFPKITGVVFCRPVSKMIAIPLQYLIYIEYPLIVVSEIISKMISKESKYGMSSNEITALAEVSTSEGSLDQLEGSVIKNIINLDSKLVKDILTPRVVVKKFSEDDVLSEKYNDIVNSNFSRILIHSSESEDQIKGYLYLRDVLKLKLESEADSNLKDLVRDIKVIPELMAVDKLLIEMVENKEHICSVVDEHGSFVGIITLEDIIEEIVGKEIVDETDSVSDMRLYAKYKRK